jgi:hypothetical protein
MDLARWEEIFEKEISEVASVDDPAHDLLHFRRVVAMSQTPLLSGKGSI